MSAPNEWVMRLGTFAVRASCVAHPDAPMRRYNDVAACSECGETVALCLDRFASKECVLEKGHGGDFGHSSPSGSSWPSSAPDPRDVTISALRAGLSAAATDLAQASVLLRAAEARHEREHAADVEALRELEATCTGLRGEIEAARADAEALRAWNRGRDKRDEDVLAAFTAYAEGIRERASRWKRLAKRQREEHAFRDAALRFSRKGRAEFAQAHADLARVTAERDFARKVAEYTGLSRDGALAALAAADALADAVAEAGPLSVRAVQATAAYRAARGGMR